MNKRQRITAAIQGPKPDRPPVSFWHHFDRDQWSGQPAVEAHVRHYETYDLDFLKVMNDNGYPHAGLVRSTSDLKSIHELGGDEAEFTRQLELLSSLRKRLGPDAILVTTIFNAFSILRHMIKPPTEHNPPELDASHDVPSREIAKMTAIDRAGVAEALNLIAASLANFARRCIDAGADGIFLSVRDDWVETTFEIPGEYQRLVRPGDLAILRAASGANLNMLHVCGRATDLRAYNDYPVDVINWADRSAGPGISDVKEWMKPAMAGGVDNLTTLPNGSAADVRREVADAIAQAGDRPIIITPGCTYDPKRVPEGSLRAMREAVQSAPMA